MISYKYYYGKLLRIYIYILKDLFSLLFWKWSLIGKLTFPLLKRLLNQNLLLLKFIILWFVFGLVFLFFFIEYRLSKYPTFFILASYTCDATWQLHGNMCYQFNDTRLSWSAARTACQGEGADLVKITNDDIQGFISCKYYNLLIQQFWCINFSKINS